jgi:hypothetical protein
MMKHHTNMWPGIIAVMGLLGAAVLADAANSSLVIAPGQQFSGKSYNCCGSH